MLLKIIIGIILFLVLFYIIFGYLFPVKLVTGNSMNPTLHDDDWILSKKVYKRDNLKLNNIYIFKSPSGRIAIKRLVDYSEGNCFFVGDNSKNSYDSRNYGWIYKEDVIAEVIWFPKHRMEEK